MWPFSSAPARRDDDGGCSGDRPLPCAAAGGDEESPPPAATHDSDPDDPRRDGNRGDDRQEASPATKRRRRDEDRSRSPRRSRNRHRGLIYFREVTPSDRSAVQSLHERWFPVDYRDDFFDALCRRERMRVLPGQDDGGEPLFCEVACYRELGEREFEEEKRRRMEERTRRMEQEAGSWSFWASNDDDGIDGYECEDDSLLWEFESDDENDDAGTTDSTSQQEEGSCASNGTHAYDAIESGESMFSVHRRREREKMRRFYANGFRHDDEEEETNGDANDLKVCGQCATRSKGNNDCYGRQKITGHHGESRDDVDRNRQSGSDAANEVTRNDLGERIAGCVVGAFLPSSMPPTNNNRSKSRPDNAVDADATLDGQKPAERDETARLLVPDPRAHPSMFYIMTLGTAREFRRCGLGSVLVERVIKMIEETERGGECGALYLHVITYNEGAMRLYERMGFSRVKEIKDYYTINSVNYDCYLYARYFHGNRGHKTALGQGLVVLYDLAASVIRKLGRAIMPA